MPLLKNIKCKESNIESKTIDLTTTANSTVEKQTISNDDIFDEVDTEEGAVKKILNVMLNIIIFFNPHRWGEIHKALNNGIVGKEVPAKDCYRIGFINELKEFAKTHNILLQEMAINFMCIVANIG